MAGKGKRGSKAKETPKGKEVMTVGFLGALEKFEYEGVTYSRRRITSAGVVCLADSGDRAITLPPETEVMPVSKD
jgi:hypothetical protein